MKISVGVFFGGRSVEHEVSVISAVQAMHAMDLTRYDVHPFYITKQGTFYTGASLLEVERYRDLKSLLAKCVEVTLVRRSTGEIWAMRAHPKRFGSSDVVCLDVGFPIVHGTNTEDGSIQGFFETLQLPYVGCDVAASAIGMDKMVQKQVLQAAQLPVLPAACYHARDLLAEGDQALERIEAAFGYPVMVKPVNLGSSIGIRKAEDRDALRDAIDFAAAYSHRLLFEPALTQFREINCAVLGDPEAAESSLCEEPVTAGTILSYSDKYLSGGKGVKTKSLASTGMSEAQRRLPADLSAQQEQEIRSLALAAFAAIGCSGVVRIDFLLDLSQGGTVYVNELNTIPGSLSSYLFAPMGIPYPELMHKLIQLAFKRQRERENLVFSYDTNIFDTQQTGSLKGIKKL